MGQTKGFARYDRIKQIKYWNKIKESCAHYKLEI